MAFEPRVLVDLFGDMMKRVELDLSNKFNDVQKPFYHYGHTQELINDLLAKSNSNVDRFPLVYLLQDFDEDYNVEDHRVQYEANVVIYIINHTDANFKVTDRYEQVFKQTLYPIYQTLIQNLATYKHFGFPIARVPHTKTDLLYWGNGAANFSNDAIDAIRITNLNIPVMKNKC